MVQEWVVVLGLGLALGLVLGYCSAMPRVWRLEKELAQALEPQKATGKKVELLRVLVKKLQSELDLAQVRLSDSELELVRVKQKAHLRESELEMALELAHSKVMAKD
jgi:hypothetical protein